MPKLNNGNALRAGGGDEPNYLPKAEAKAELHGTVGVNLPGSKTKEAVANTNTI
jgi:hypothetical protein